MRVVCTQPHFYVHIECMPSIHSANSKTVDWDFRWPCFHWQSLPYNSNNLILIQYFKWVQHTHHTHTHMSQPLSPAHMNTTHMYSFHLHSQLMCSFTSRFVRFSIKYNYVLYQINTNAFRFSLPQSNINVFVVNSLTSWLCTMLIGCGGDDDDNGGIAVAIILTFTMNAS